jgi:hypothetical protein
MNGNGEKPVSTEGELGDFVSSVDAAESEAAERMLIL